MASSTTEDFLTSQTNNMTAPENPFSDGLVIVAATLIIPMAVFGILANLLTIVVIGTSTSLRSVFNTVIISLCVSDLLAAINSPLNLYRRTWGFQKWEISDFLCKFYMGSTFWTCFATALHILLFSILRLISMQWPYQYKEIKQSQVKICVVLIWALTFCAGVIPGAVAFGSGQRQTKRLLALPWPDCTIILRKGHAFKLISLITYPILVYIPIALTALFSAWTAVALLRRRAERSKKPELIGTEATKKRRHETNRKIEKKENHAMLQLGLIVGSFLLGYVPLTAYIFKTTSSRVITIEEAEYDWKFWFITYILLRLSECLNPIFYNIASSRMRRETMRILFKILRRRAPFEGKKSRSSVTSYSVKYTQSTERRDTMETVIPKLLGEKKEIG